MLRDFLSAVETDSSWSKARQEREVDGSEGVLSNVPGLFASAATPFPPFTTKGTVGYFR